MSLNIDDKMSKGFFAPGILSLDREKMRPRRQPRKHDIPALYGAIRRGRNAGHYGRGPVRIGGREGDYGGTVAGNQAGRAGNAQRGRSIAV